MDNRKFSAEITEILTVLLKCGVFGEKADEETACKLTSDTLISIYTLSSEHDLSHIVGEVLEKNGLLPKGVAASLYRQEVMTAVFRYEKLCYAFSQGCEILEEAQIPFIPLKGAVLHNIYPENRMRLSCDVDILIHKEDMPKAVKLFEDKLKYENCGESFHDVRLKSPDGVIFELHHTLIEDGFANNANKILKKVWDHTYPREGCRFHRLMTDEMFYFYHIAHIAKHIEHGGCGIKPLLDLYVMGKCMKPPSKELLKKCNLLTFDGAVTKLSKVWFDGDKHDEASLLLQKFVLEGGVYGNRENLAYVRKGRTGGKVGYILSRVFLPYSKLKYEYPVLQKRKLLFPVYTVYRWLGFIFKGNKEARIKNLNSVKDVSSEKSEEIAELLEKIGL